MTDLLQGLLDDLTAEGDQLRATVERLGPDGWTRPTPAPGWTVATQVAHLLWTDEVAVVAAHSHESPEAKQAWDDVVLAAINDPMGYVDAARLRARRAAARRDPGALGRQPRRRSAPPSPGCPRARRCRGSARRCRPPRWRPRGSWRPGRTRSTSTTPQASGRSRPTGSGTSPTSACAPATTPTRCTRRSRPAEEFRVELTAPSGDALGLGARGRAPSAVRGSAYDFCLLVTQRVNRADTDLVAVGADAEHWLSIAQAFAGPPGPGREATA